MKGIEDFAQERGDFEAVEICETEMSENGVTSAVSFFWRVILSAILNVVLVVVAERSFWLKQGTG